MKTNRAKLFGIIALVAIIGVTFAACANPASDFEVRIINLGKWVEITKYIGDKWEVGIPSKIQGLPVTRIGDNAFANKLPALERVTIPKSVTTIGDNAFDGAQLTSVTIGANVAIGGYAFYEVRSFSNGLFSLDNGFKEAYNAASKKAGTYTRPNIDSNDWKKR